MRSIKRSDGGILLYEPSFVEPEIADRYFVELRDECAWAQKPGVIGNIVC